MYGRRGSSDQKLMRPLSGIPTRSRPPPRLLAQGLHHHRHLGGHENTPGIGAGLTWAS